MFTDLKIHNRFYISFWSKIKRFGKQVSDFKVALQLLLYGHIEPERASRLARNARNSEVKLRFDRHFEFLCQIVLCEIFEPKNNYKISAEILRDSFAFRLVQVDHRDLLIAYENFETFIFEEISESKEPAIGKILDSCISRRQDTLQKIEEITLALSYLNDSDLREIANASGNYLRKYCNLEIVEVKVETVVEEIVEKKVETIVERDDFRKKDFIEIENTLKSCLAIIQMKGEIELGSNDFIVCITVNVQCYGCLIVINVKLNLCHVPYDRGRFNLRC